MRSMIGPLKHVLAQMVGKRLCMSKEEVAAPVVMLESIFTIASIEAKEGRDVPIIDLPGAFLCDNSDKDVII